MKQKLILSTLLITALTASTCCHAKRWSYSTRKKTKSALVNFSIACTAGATAYIMAPSLDNTLRQAEGLVRRRQHLRDSSSTSKAIANLISAGTIIAGPTLLSKLLTNKRNKKSFLSNLKRCSIPVSSRTAGFTVGYFLAHFFNQPSATTAQNSNNSSTNQSTNDENNTNPQTSNSNQNAPTFEELDDEEDIKLPLKKEKNKV